MEKYQIVLKEKFNATADEIFTALTDHDKIYVWSGSEGFIEPKVGGYCEWFDGEIKGRVIEFDPGNKLLLKLQAGNGNSESELTFNIIQGNGSSEFSMEHDVDAEGDVDEARQEWWKTKVMKPLQLFFMEE